MIPQQMLKQNLGRAELDCSHTSSLRRLTVLHRHVGCARQQMRVGPPLARQRVDRTARRRGLERLIDLDREGRVVLDGRTKHERLLWHGRQMGRR